MSNQKKPNTKGTEPMPTGGGGLAELSFDNSDFDLNLLKVDKTLQNEIKAKGLPYKFINYVKFKASGGVHKGGWVPYKRESKPEAAFAGGYATDPDGYTVRNELVLATRDPRLHVYRQQQIAVQNKRQADITGLNRQAAAEMRARMRDQGLSGRIHEGYDENDQE